MIEFITKYDKTFEKDLIAVEKEIATVLSLPQNTKITLSFVSQNKIKTLNK